MTNSLFAVLETRFKLVTARVRDAVARSHVTRSRREYGTAHTGHFARRELRARRIAARDGTGGGGSEPRGVDRVAQRQVEARECIGLRQVVAWVLVVLAEEREAAERARAPSSGAFPASPAPSLRAPPAPAGAAPPPRRATRLVPPKQSAPAEPCAASGPRWQLGSELSVAVGLVDAVALGPAIAVRYRPCARWLPSVSLGGSRLVSFGYELDSRSISIERTSAQAGAWTTLGVPALRVGMVLEAGRIRATGTPSARGPGATSLAPWFACAVPARLSVPLLTGALAASTGVDAVYTPLSSLSVPTYWGNSNNCARRESDGVLFLVNSPQLAREWDDCTPEEQAATEHAQLCP